MDVLRRGHAGVHNRTHPWPAWVRSGPYLASCLTKLAPTCHAAKMSHLHGYGDRQDDIVYCQCLWSVLRCLWPLWQSYKPAILDQAMSYV